MLHVRLIQVYTLGCGVHMVYVRLNMLRLNMVRLNVVDAPSPLYPHTAKLKHVMRV